MGPHREYLDYRGHEVKKIFLDIGAYDGQSTRAALLHKFDEIHMFEPSSVMRGKLEDLAARYSEVHFHPFGLLDKDCTKTLLRSGSTGATIYQDKIVFEDYFPPWMLAHEKCEFRGARDWYQKNIAPKPAYLWVKLNCEGAEIVIIDELIPILVGGGMDHLMVDFDACKIPSLGNHVLRTRERLRADSVDVFDITLTESSPADCINAWMDPQR